MEQTVVFNQSQFSFFGRGQPDASSRRDSSNRSWGPPMSRMNRWWRLRSLGGALGCDVGVEPGDGNGELPWARVAIPACPGGSRLRASSSGEVVTVEGVVMPTATRKNRAAVSPASPHRGRRSAQLRGSVRGHGHPALGAVHRSPRESER